MTQGLLSGLRVVELGESRAAGFACKLLADLGAEVWLLEPVGRGSILRRRRPLLPSGESGLFAFLARGKRSVSVDLTTSDGRELARRFIALGDGVIADAALWATLVEDGDGVTAPKGAVAVVTVSGRGWPEDAKCVPSEFVDFHEGGGGYMTPGQAHDPRAEYPLDLAQGGQASYVGGVYTVFAFLNALALTRSTTEGVWNDVSNQASVASMMLLNVPWYHYAGQVPSRLAAAKRPTIAFGGFVRVKDGRVNMVLVEEHQWQGLIRVLGTPEWSSWPVFATQLERSSNWDAIQHQLEEALVDTTRAEFVEKCQQQMVPVFPVRSMQDILESKHEHARQFFSTVEGDSTLLPTNPWVIDNIPPRSTAVVPALGEHTREAFYSVGLNEEDYDIFRELGVVE
jgi:crotonobetainyl-CoA:carnitine CoA-transferase CaiB-like acyl-CoA transferase